MFALQLIDLILALLLDPTDLLPFTISVDTIEVTKPHPEIHISPLAGDILGLQTTPIDFAYNPKSFSTAEAEISIRTSQFDS